MGSQLGSSGLRATVSRQGMAISRRIAMNHAGECELVGNPEISCQKCRLSIALDWCRLLAPVLLRQPIF